jgi:hypothetical protein
MSVVVTYPTLSNPANKVEVETNFADLVDKFDGNILNADIGASAAIQTSKLEVRNYEFLMPFSIRPTTAVAPPTSATVPIATHGLPGTSTDGTYTIKSGNWIIEDAGTAASTTFNMQLGYYSAGVWTAVGADLVSATTITGGTKAQSGSLTINTALITLHASTPYFIALFLTAVGTGALNEAHLGLTVTLKLIRTDGLRGT